MADELDFGLEGTMVLTQDSISEDRLPAVSEAHESVRNAFLALLQSIDAKKAWRRCQIA